MISSLNLTPIKYNYFHWLYWNNLILPHVQHSRPWWIVYWHIVFKDMLIVSCIVNQDLINKKLYYNQNLVEKKSNYSQNLIDKNLDYNHNCKATKVKMWRQYT
jgi:hypothetical protein